MENSALNDDVMRVGVAQQGFDAPTSLPLSSFSSFAVSLHCLLPVANYIFGVANITRSSLSDLIFHTELL